MVNANEVELLAPAGNFETALAAFEAGADAVYCGLPEFSARAFADNLSVEDLKNLIRYARAPRMTGQRSEVRGQRSEGGGQRSEVRGQGEGQRSDVGGRRKVYVTFNTLIDEGDVESAVEQLAKLDEIRPDALIVQDLGVARLCRTYFPDLALHASTQLVAHNLEGVLAMKDLGFSRVVLARELSLEEIASIAKRCGVELECFIHGALCYSVSGLCLFGAMEKDRSGNRGKCPYCCRQAMEVLEEGVGDRCRCTAEGASYSAPQHEQDVRLHRKPAPDTYTSYPFSMKDLRLGEDVRKLVDAGVASLKIEGRMKSALYVASVTRYYRQILGQRSEVKGQRGRVSLADLETVFSRRTTELYFNGSHVPSLQPPTSNLQPPTSNFQPVSPIDSESLGHLGAEIGTVKRITKDREGLSWLRFHTVRGLEKHDGLQFEAMVDGKHVGMGVVEMRQAISRRPVFEVNAGVDVEVLLPTGNAAADGPDLTQVLKPGMKIYCSMSNAVKRMFPTPSFRPSDYAGGTVLDLTVTLSSRAIAVACGQGLSASVACELTPAKNPEKTYEGVKKAFSKLGETDYRLGRLTVEDPNRLFAPMSTLNDLRRDLVEQLDELRDRTRRDKIERALADADGAEPTGAAAPAKTLKVRFGQKIPSGTWDEVVVAINSAVDREGLQAAVADFVCSVRLALPVYTREPEFNRLRVTVKGLLRTGFDKWEASDLATLRMLRAQGVTDITADWTLYAFNLSALRQLSALGVKRFVASPENGRENLQFLRESGFAVEFLAQQSTPLFVSLTQPAAFPRGLACFVRDGLWVTTKPTPRTFAVPEGGCMRLDLSWDPD